MPTDEKTEATEQATEQSPAYVTREDLAAVVNQAITGHLKRVKWDELLAPVVARSMPKPAPEAPKSDGQSVDGKTADPRVKMLEEQMAELRRQNAEALERARATSLAAARDKTRATVREQLEARGVRGTKAKAVISMLEAEGHLAYDEEGRAALTVKRARGPRGTPAEVLTHDDLVEGLDDWAKTDEAAEFLPAPVAAKPAPKPGAAPPVPPAQPGQPGRPISLSAAVDAAVAAIEAGSPPNR